MKNNIFEEFKTMTPEQYENCETESSIIKGFLEEERDSDINFEINTEQEGNLSV